MSEESGADKSFDATPEKKKKARKKGNVPMSTDLNTLAAYLGFVLALTGAGTLSLNALGSIVGFVWYPDETSAQLLKGDNGANAFFGAPMRMTGSLIGAAGVAVLLCVAGQQAVTFAPTKIKPDLKRIAPWEGVKRRYGPDGMVEFLRSALKLVAVSAAGFLYLWSRREEYISLVGRPANELSGLLLGELWSIMLIGIGVVMVSAAIDVPFKRASHAKKLRMTKQEVSDENKEMEGDPQQKQARRKRAQEFATSQMLRDAADADVVIVNPTHYAVALKWNREAEQIPVCVAKGVDELALVIIDRARSSGVPVREDPPCARALHATVDVGQPIKSEHFIAVAAAIRFAYRVRGKSMESPI